ncbi:hypothetical protein PF049_01535 [Erythrobacteraceae bacterium WH01K]|nr:hypothetical protein PF049_01535 [Erythrobacteraceae bacterium WH01K]
MPRPFCIRIHGPALKAVAAVAAMGGAMTMPAPVLAQSGSLPPFQGAPTYADLADLADGAPLVLKAEVKRQAQVKPERAPGLAPGHARLYLEAETLSLISGTVPVGESLKYLVDVPLDSRGKAPKLKKSEVILFARPVTGRASEIQLVNPSAQLMWSAQTEQRMRPILAELASADAPPRVTGIRDALSVAGNLVGESETQLFLDTEGRRPASITVTRRPDMEPAWGVSWTEIVDRAAMQPRPQSLRWYRLACFLPASLPADANLSSDNDDRQRAERDYAYVMQSLGPCPRNL